QFPVAMEGGLSLPSEVNVGRGRIHLPGSPGGYPARAPTDPDMQISRIRLVRSTLHPLRYTEWTTRGAGSGRWPSSAGWDCLPTGFQRKGFRCSYILPPFPGFPGATFTPPRTRALQGPGTALGSTVEEPPTAVGHRASWTVLPCHTTLAAPAVCC